MEDGLELGDGGVRKSAVKSGRRARQVAEPMPEESRHVRKPSSSTSMGEDEEGDEEREIDQGPPPKPPRRQGGWADETPGSAKTERLNQGNSKDNLNLLGILPYCRSGRRPATEEMEDRRLRPQTPERSDDEGGPLADTRESGSWAPSSIMRQSDFKRPRSKRTSDTNVCLAKLLSFIFIFLFTFLSLILK
ncbi:intraflagellar transport protein 43 homolog isoform X7 [Amia ocellicauda]|uniref:intraflagellar transport protein 43 homolog isoform X7 n=1 Tax=Amia ocellicauda TaxID=2972642 RepID=UPI003464ABD3